MRTYLWRWDLALFHAVHSSTPPSYAMLTVARGLASGPLLLTAGLLGMMLLWPRCSMRPVAVQAILAALGVLAVNGLIGLAWDRPRPFVAGVGRAWVTHAATGSFPSDHLTLQWTVAGVLWLNGRTRGWGIAVGLLGLPMAWARIYLGVHYPSDMLGALGAAGLTIFLVSWSASRRRCTGIPSS
ncbi:MAG: undecaprenyl-diphosphatase [Xanthomonadaceae bacterium]|nr:undecaprenyl-diphosphatase [Xanthomonadaceae bacterium]